MYAAIHLPDFALQAAMRWKENTDGRPVVVIHRETAEVIGCTLDAAARGVHLGMNASQAAARCPSLAILPQSPTSEQTVSALLLECGLSHSPLMEQTAPDLVTLDLRGVHYQVDWYAMGDQMVKDLREFQLQAQVAFAGTPDVARLAVRAAKPVDVIRDSGAFLRPLPVSFLTHSSEVLEVLHDWGIRTVGAFLDLPKAESIAKLGEEAQAMWRLASGRSNRPLKQVALPEAYEESCDLEYAVETTEPLLFLLRRFVDQLEVRLRARYLVAACMQLRLPLDQKGSHERAFSVPEPTAEADVLFRILSTHLESLILDDCPTGVSLRLEAAKPTRQQAGLFGASLRDPNRFGETLARLGAIVGSENVGFARLANTFKPDSVHLGDSIPTEIDQTQPATATFFGLPLVRFRPPVHAVLITRDRTPIHIRSAIANGAITESAGPYRLSGNWWEAGRWELEEWDVCLETGFYRIARAGDAWQVEGSYEVC